VDLAAVEADLASGLEWTCFRAPNFRQASSVDEPFNRD
jgi:hypothetical protein